MQRAVLITPVQPGRSWCGAGSPPRASSQAGGGSSCEPGLRLGGGQKPGFVKMPPVIPQAIEIELK